jgi:hypothetical protein
VDITEAMETMNPVTCVRAAVRAIFTGWFLAEDAEDAENAEDCLLP